MWPFKKYSRFILRHVPGFEDVDYNPEAAIVNFYTMDSSIGGHTDHSEPNQAAPLGNLYLLVVLKPLYWSIVGQAPINIGFLQLKVTIFASLVGEGLCQIMVLGQGMMVALMPRAQTIQVHN